MTNPQKPSPLLRLSPADNVATATAALQPGTVAGPDGQSLTILNPIAIGHKVAIVPISKGAKIIKFGCPIGSATTDIPAGQHVHTHNVKSDYIPTFTLETGKKFVESAGH